ncbi:DUF2283 domain-containing protein [Candidatus Pacearchaeota archaeon]|nr:DUF2283 domain-containing protein [Candidatus Pacearchaeota archaeon]
MENQTYDIYYDEEGDFLEITFGLPSEKEYTEEIEEGVFITKDEETREIKGIGILSFKKRSRILKEILQKVKMRFPLEIDA